MIAVIRTNNPATISFAEAILKEAGIGYFVADTHSSIIEGSIGVIPRRIMVLEDDEYAARRALTLSGLEDELCQI